MGKQVYSITELNQQIKGLLDGRAELQGVCVQGEISNYKPYASGHHYFSLKDENSSLKCVMFRGYAMKLRFRPENGMKVLAIGNVTLYQADGKCELLVVNMQPQGRGDLDVAFEQLKKKLEAEGLFDPAHKKPLPRLPATIAVITSGSGDAVNDIINVTGRRWPLAKIRVIPVLVQGDGAPQQIAAALRWANRWNVAELIITGRGGGSREELWAFNDEGVARAIYESRIPVITAVGHDPDVTLADYVADRSALTPTFGAQLATEPGIDWVRGELQNLGQRLERALEKRLDEQERALEPLARRLAQAPASCLERKQRELEAARGAVLAAQERRLTALNEDFVRKAASLDKMSPLRVLGRGYAIASDADGRTIRSVAETSEGARINVRLWDGSLGCRVESRKEQNHDNG